MLNVKELEEFRRASEAAPDDGALLLRFEEAVKQLPAPETLPRFDPRENYFLDRGSLAFQSASFPAVFGDSIVDGLLGLSTTDVHVSAWSLSEQRRVVLKILKPENDWVGGDFTERWRCLNQLPEGVLTPLLSWGEIEGLWCFVFPFQDGLSVASQMWTLKQQSTGNFKALQKLACALEQSHKQGIYHGQINERNVLLGEGESVYLIGYEKCLWAGPEPYDLAKRPLYYGHPENFAPEQWSGALKCDERVDVYQLGLLMYQLISFRKPFPPARNLVSAIKKVLDDGPVDPRTWNPGLDSGIAEVCLKALKRSEDRYQSAGDFARALDSLPDFGVPQDLDEKPQALKPEALDRTRTWFRGLQKALRQSRDWESIEDSPEDVGEAEGQ